MVLFLVLFINYILIISFLESHYFIYFFMLTLILYALYKIEIKKVMFSVCLFFILVSPFLFQFFDNYIFESYLFFDLESFYTFVGGEVSYILAPLHAFLFFLGYNSKNYL